MPDCGRIYTRTGAAGGAGDGTRASAIGADHGGLLPRAGGGHPDGRPQATGGVPARPAPSASVPSGPRVPSGVPPPSAAATDPASRTSGGSGGGDGGGGDGPVDGPVDNDLDRDDADTRLGATGADATIKAGGHLDVARQSAASAVRSATVEVAAAAAACEAAGVAGPVAPLRDASTLLAKLLAENPLHARGTTSYASAVLVDAESAWTAVLQAVAAVTVPPRRPPAAVTGDGGAADVAACAATSADNAAIVACRRLCTRARHAASSVFSAAKGLIPMENPDVRDHPGDDTGACAGGAPARVGGKRSGRRHCCGCGATGHYVRTCPADAAAKAAHAARVAAEGAAKGARAGSGRTKCSACHARSHTRASAACPLRAVAHGWSDHNEDRGRDLACAVQYRMTGEVTTTVAVSVDRFFGVWRRRLPGLPQAARRRRDARRPPRLIARPRRPPRPSPMRRRARLRLQNWHRRRRSNYASSPLSCAARCATWSSVSTAMGRVRVVVAADAHSTSLWRPCRRR